VANKVLAVPNKVGVRVGDYDGRSVVATPMPGPCFLGCDRYATFAINHGGEPRQIRVFHARHYTMFGVSPQGKYDRLFTRSRWPFLLLVTLTGCLVATDSQLQLQMPLRARPPTFPAARHSRSSLLPITPLARDRVLPLLARFSPFTYSRTYSRTYRGKAAMGAVRVPMASGQLSDAEKLTLTIVMIRPSR